MINSDLPEIDMTADTPTIRDWTPASLHTLLSIYEEELTSQGFQARTYLQTGLSNDEVRSKLRELSMVPPEELLTWFAWANGSDVPLPGIRPASLEQAIDQYVQVDLYLYENPPPGLESVSWGAGPGWLRLEPSNYSKAINCGTDQSNPPEVHQTDPDTNWDDSSYGRCRSLSTLVTWWIEGLRAGAYTWMPTNHAWSITDFSAIPDAQKRRGLV